MKKLLSFLCLLLFAGLLVGCDSVQIKQQLQTSYDKNNPNGDKGVCLYLGRIKNYPYTTKYMEKDPYDDIPFLSNEEFKKRLTGFTEIGLFTQEKVGQDHGEEIYRYNLTELGQQYLIPEGFCFGRINVTGIEKSDSVTDSIGQTVKMVHFRFKIENVPDWVKENIPTLKQLFGDYVEEFLLKEEGSKMVRFIKTTDGWYIQGGVKIRYGFYLAAPED